MLINIRNDTIENRFCKMWKKLLKSAPPHKKFIEKQKHVRWHFYKVDQWEPSEVAAGAPAFIPMCVQQINDEFRGLPGTLKVHNAQHYSCMAECSSVLHAGHTKPHLHVLSADKDTPPFSDFDQRCKMLWPSSKEGRRENGD